MTERLVRLVEECPDGPREKSAPPASPVPAARDVREKLPVEREAELRDELNELREPELLELEECELELLELELRELELRELELRELELRELELLELELCPLGGIIVPRSFSLGNRIGQKCIDVFAFIIQKSGK